MTVGPHLLLALVLPGSLPHSLVSLDAHLLAVAVDQLVQAAQIHWPVEEWDHVFVEGLPVWVLQMVLLALLETLVESGESGVWFGKFWCRGTVKGDMMKRGVMKNLYVRSRARSVRQW